MSASPRPLVDDTADVVPVYCTARAHIALVLLLAGMTPAERKACSRVCRPWRAAASDPAAWASLSAEHREFCTAAGAASERAAVGDCDFCAAASAAADKAAAPTELMMDYRRSHARRNLLSSSKCKSAVANLALTSACSVGGRALQLLTQAAVRRGEHLRLARLRLDSVRSPFSHASVRVRGGGRCSYGRGAPAAGGATGRCCRCSALQLPPGHAHAWQADSVPL